MPFSKLLIFLILVAFTFVQDVNAQVEKSSELFQVLTKADSLLFEEGFNKCNLSAVEGAVYTDFEFYHDQNGVQNRAEFFDVFKESICSSPDRKPIRQLVPGSLEVFRLKNNGQTYGAIQKGEHQFYIKEPNKELYLTSTGKFTHLWVLDHGKWKLKRGLSYDHKQPSPVDPKE